ncbi:hypothetical protein [Sulfuricurvum sp.]|uniref:hypothetical protein n=1 Tax=Sulfuricurvum sp. TaxID=2025608 RepID=UPI00286DA3DC|nr:hypothetical protein [Sulfuricurvum sp.]
MKPLLIALSFFTAAALACGNPSNSFDSGYSAHSTPALIEPITYALDQIGMEDNSDIRTAVHLYKKEVRSLTPSIPTEAFQGSNFNPGAYALNSPDAKALKAQIDLFDTIYLILNDEQKKQFPIFIGMYQHHMKFVNSSKMCTSQKKGCDGDKSKSCGAKSCDTPKNVKLTPKR